MANTANVGIPAHMRIGRGNGAGPVTGGYITFNAGPLTVIESTTSKLTPVFLVPFDFRLEKISWNFRTASGGTVDTIGFYKNATASLTGATSLSSGVGQFDLDYVTDSWLLPSGETIQTSGLTLSTVAGVRDVAAGQYIFASITTDATAGGIIDLNVQFLGVMLSHTKPNSEND